MFGDSLVLEAINTLANLATAAAAAFASRRLAALVKELHTTRARLLEQQDSDQA